MVLRFGVANIGCCEKFNSVNSMQDTKIYGRVSVEGLFYILCFSSFNLLLFLSTKIIIAAFCLGSCSPSKEQDILLVLVKALPLTSCFYLEIGEPGDTINLPGMPGLKGEVGVPGLTGTKVAVTLDFSFFTD